MSKSVTHSSSACFQGICESELNALRQQFLRAAAKYAMVFRFLCCMLFGVSIFVCTRKISSTAGGELKCIVRAGKQMKLRAEHSAEGHGQKPQTCCGIHLQKLSWFLLIYLLILHTYTYKTRLSLCRLLFQWRPLIATNSTSWDGWCSAGEWVGGSGKNLTQMYMRLMTTRCRYPHRTKSKTRPLCVGCVPALLAGLWRRQGSSSWTWHPLGQVLAERHIPHGVADEQREQIPLFVAAGWLHFVVPEWFSVSMVGWGEWSIQSDVGSHQSVIRSSTSIVIIVIISEHNSRKRKRITKIITCKYRVIYTRAKPLFLQQPLQVKCTTPRQNQNLRSFGFKEEIWYELYQAVSCERYSKYRYQTC